MSDARLRELERRWRQGGSVADEAALLAERMRTGELTRERVELAAWCGLEAARIVVNVQVPPLARMSREWLAALLGNHGAQGLVRVMLNAARLAGSNLDDQNLAWLGALDSAGRAWLGCPCRECAEVWMKTLRSIDPRLPTIDPRLKAVFILTFFADPPRRFTDIGLAMLRDSVRNWDQYGLDWEELAHSVLE